MSKARVVIHTGADVLAPAVAARLAVRLVDAQAEHGSASIVLTGGRIAGKIYAALAEAPASDAVAWDRVDLWWGDERFLPSGDRDRNETQIRSVLLDKLPVAADRVHPMPASDGPDGDDPQAGAIRYAEDLASAAAGRGELPRFDVVLLGIGEDGHVASVFPDHPLVDPGRPVSAVRDSPKPPPTRTTLTLGALNTAEDVWILASGPEKADAVGRALGGADAAHVPAAGVRGTRRTLWLLDRAAAAGVAHQ